MVGGGGRRVVVAEPNVLRVRVVLRVGEGAGLNPSNDLEVAIAQHHLAVIQS